MADKEPIASPVKEPPPTSVVPTDEKQLEERKDEKKDEKQDVEEPFSLEDFPKLSVVKYGRRGKPHVRVLCLSAGPTEASFIWCKPRLAGKKRPTSAPISVRDIVDIRKGKNTGVFKRPAARDALDERCMSVVTVDRTLDFELSSQEERDRAAQLIENLYQRVTKMKLLLGVRVRRQSALLERQEFFNEVENHLLSLHQKTREIWDRGMRSNPAEMIDKDFPRLAKNFKIFFVTTKIPAASSSIGDRSPSPSPLPTSPSTPPTPSTPLDSRQTPSRGSHKTEDKTRTPRTRSPTPSKKDIIPSIPSFQEIQDLKAKSQKKPKPKRALGSIIERRTPGSDRKERDEALMGFDASVSFPGDPLLLTPERYIRKRQSSVPVVAQMSSPFLDTKTPSTPGEFAPVPLRRRKSQPVLSTSFSFQIHEPESTTEEYVRKRIDLCEYTAPTVANVRSVMQSLASRLLSKKCGEDMLSRFVAQTTAAEGGLRDISIIIKEFFDTEFKDVMDSTKKTITGSPSSIEAGGGSSSSSSIIGSSSSTFTSMENNHRAFLALLKTCNQNIIFPAVYLLKQVILDPFRARDVHEKGGWAITIEFHEHKTLVIHKRREICDTGQFTYQWGLTMTLDTSFELVETSLAITELKFLDGASPRVKNELSTKLFSVNRLGSIIAKRKQDGGRRNSAPARTEELLSPLH